MEAYSLQMIHDWGLSAVDGIKLVGDLLAPAIEDDEHKLFALG